MYVLYSMKKKRSRNVKKTLLAILLFVCLIPVFSNGRSEESNNDDHIVITYFTKSVTFSAKADELNAALHEAYPNIDLEISHIADNYDTTVKTRFTTGEAPQIISWNNTVSDTSFPSNGYFVDLSGLGLEENLVSDFVELGQYDGKLYGIPVQAQSSGLIYNKDCFEKAGISELPRTFDELEEVCEKLKAVGIVPFAVGFKEVWVCNQFVWKMIGPYVGNMNEWKKSMDEGTGSFLTEDSYRGFELINIVLANTFDKPLSYDAAMMSHKLGTGEAAMMFLGAFQYDTVMKSNPDCRLGLAPIPHFEDSSKAVIEYAPQEFIFVSSQNNDNVDACKDVMRWFASKEGATAVSSIIRTASPFT